MSVLSLSSLRIRDWRPLPEAAKRAAGGIGADALAVAGDGSPGSSGPLRGPKPKQGGEWSMRPPVALCASAGFEFADGDRLRERRESPRLRTGRRRQPVTDLLDTTQSHPVPGIVAAEIGGHEIRTEVDL